MSTSLIYDTFSAVESPSAPRGGCRFLRYLLVSKYLCALPLTKKKNKNTELYRLLKKWENVRNPLKVWFVICQEMPLESEGFSPLFFLWERE